ncbi:enoyl-[acyl-carrier protein] reductase III [Pullulanibacillus pueri]|uniref:Enoyl-[acyl-carrier-protein] reductase n=1 Tax=Pullulanibacillus pueri TaxID=1437324 RepID=A0A8J3EL96_9BACL|nr:SDR family oxidoreductase [Pullulanibacillus pueri]MBM7680726.1 enoyl-[acyl-carrier protein] reductase III [Pullulanibacillus pueri]GGH78096.1 enoyl-[acyl-carrier-protein] reductase [Pullulanibacillus pueri]
MGDTLKGKKALITGSSRGIGRATALKFAEEGADIVIHYRREGEAAEQTAEEVRRLGRQALIFKADLDSSEDIDAMFDYIEKQWGALDIFIANAAATAFKDLLDIKPHHITKTYQVVVNSTLQAVQRAVPLMEGREGRIITVSSMGSELTLPRYANIGSAKAALESLTRYFAKELGPKGITANCVSPGVVETDSLTFYAGDRFETYRKGVIAKTPLGRFTQPEDVSNLSLFLASSASSFITGQVIKIDGGLTINNHYPPEAEF